MAAVRTVSVRVSNLTIAVYTRHIALKELGFETIIVNCNPETVSTDYDTSDKLYFEPLTLEDVLSIHEKEKPVGVIAQFGGQTPLNLAADLKANGVNILGTTPETIDMAEDRDEFREMMDKLHIPMPESGMAVTVDDALAIAERIGYPVMVRPSYVLGGRGMEVVHDEESLRFYMNAAVGVTPDRPILIDRFLHNALECEADAISDGENVFVPAVMEHVELAGVHSGDSACVLPSQTIPADNLAQIKDYTKRIAKEMNVRGLMNMQYAIEDGVVYVLEANPRASPYCTAGIQGMQHQHGEAGNPDHNHGSDRKSFPGTGSEGQEHLSLRRKGSSIPVQYVP